MPPELVSITETAMARDKEMRYASALEFARDLESFVEGRVVRAHEAGAWAELRKWVSRNRPLAAALASGGATPRRATGGARPACSVRRPRSTPSG